MSNRLRGSFDDDKIQAAQIRKSHIGLLDILEKIEGQLRQSSLVRPLLRGLEDKLLNHFVLQNEKFYNELALFYANDHNKAKMCEGLKLDLRNLKLATVEFFDQYQVDGAHTNFADFPRSFTVFYHHILSRIKLEEERLLPLLNI